MKMMKKKPAIPRSSYRRRHNPETAPEPVDEPKQFYLVIAMIKGEDEAFSGIYAEYDGVVKAVSHFEKRYAIGQEVKDSKIFGKVITYVRTVCVLNQEIC